MSNDKIEVSISAVKGIIPCLEGEITNLEEQILGLQSALTHKQRTLAEIKAKLSGKESAAGTNGESKRLRKGEAERIILELLQHLPTGKRGLTIQEVVEQSGVPYSSTFRILNKNKNGYFDNPQGLWTISNQARK